MDLDIIKIASDTTNNKILKDYTHRSKYKNKTCGDIIEMRVNIKKNICLLYTSPSPRDSTLSRMPSSA